MYVYVNGALVPRADASVSVFDRGFLLGDGVFETMRAYGGTVFMLESHTERLAASASMAGIALPPGEAGIMDAVRETIEANSLSDAYVRVTLSRGAGPRGVDPVPCTEPTLVIMAEPLGGYPQEYYEKGIKAVVASIERVSPAALDPRIKSLSFLGNVLARREASLAGTQEAIMLNSKGHLVEGASSNVFFVSGGALKTPSAGCGILMGITREVVLGAAARGGIEVLEGGYTKEELYASQEVFITNTTMEVMPVSRVDGASFGVGGVTRRLMTAYKDEVAAYVGRNGAERGEEDGG